MHIFFKSLPSTLLIALFVYAAISKLIAFHTFGIQLSRQPFPPAFSMVLQYLIPCIELLTVGLVVFPKTFYRGLQLSLCLLILFTGYIILTLLHSWNRPACPCGGILSHLSWADHLVFNLIFLSINLIAISIYTKERRGPT